jgi:hypothetical protein
VIGERVAVTVELQRKKRQDVQTGNANQQCKDKGCEKT